ncbi:MAG: hypothetical protein SFV18_12110 [Bryobacteraceae bacterium]|nr:hypothetical protein [Bryobacteraceae bacterium]
MRFRFLAAALLVGAAYSQKKPTGPILPKNGVKTPGVQIPFANLKAEAEFAAPGKPGWFAFGERVLIPNEPQGLIARINARTNKEDEAWKGFDKPCGGLAIAFQSVWSPSCGAGTLSRIETKSGKVTAKLDAGAPVALPAVATTADSVWLLADAKTTLARIDPDTNTIVAEVRLPEACSSILFAEQSLWVTCPKESKILRIDPKTNLVAKRIETSSQPVSAAFGEGSVWVLCKAEGKVARIDPKTDKVTVTIDLGIPGAEGNIAFGEGSIWVTAPGFPISRIAPSTDKVVQQFYGDGGGAIQAGGGAVWLANQAKGTVWKLDPKRIVATLAE